jgi:hypothetical protein
MDRLLFGDNQFFGVNHMSEEKARAQAMRFQDVGSITRVLEVAHDAGVSTFMCTTHDRISEVCARVRDDGARWDGFQFYPGMPYAHKYANAVTELGMAGALRRFAPTDGFMDALVRGGRSVARKDVEGVITLLVDAELKPFQGLSTPVVFLQNVIVDLLLGLGFVEAFQVFDRHVRERYGAEPGYFTMNLPRLLDTLETAGLRNPIICANINKLGFRMSGGVDAYRQVLSEDRCQAIAMSVYASGAIPPREALEWIAEIPSVRSIVFGASSAANIHNTIDIAKGIWGPSALAL